MAVLLVPFVAVLTLMVHFSSPPFSKFLRHVFRATPGPFFLARSGKELSLKEMLLVCDIRTPTTSSAVSELLLKIVILPERSSLIEMYSIWPMDLEDSPVLPVFSRWMQYLSGILSRTSTRIRQGHCS